MLFIMIKFQGTHNLVSPIFLSLGDCSQCIAGLLLCVDENI